MNVLFKAVLLSLMMILCSGYGSIESNDFLESKTFTNKSNDSGNNSSSSNNTEIGDACTDIQDNETTWICVYPENWESEFPSEIHAIPIIIETGNMPDNVTVNLFLTGDMDWCLPAYDGNMTPILEGRCNSHSFGGGSYSDDDILFIMEGPSHPSVDGCYFLSVEMHIHNDWNNKITNFSSLTANDSSFRLGDADCSNTDYSKTTGWNNVTIAEHENNTLENLEDEENAVPGFSIIGTISILCIAAIIVRFDQ